MLTVDTRVVAPPDVLIRELDGEAVLLNLASESYFGLDEVGARMWQVLTTSESIEAAYDQLLAEYDVEPERLRQDVLDLVDQLAAHGLVDLSHD
ncbi:MAG: PqqD family protein [Anaerolineales bacterium]|nr:PqqD family protein [Anaerolineales bacterium]